MIGEAVDCGMRPRPPVAVPVPSPATETAVDDMLRLSIEATRDCWLTLEGDGKKVVDEQLHSGDHRAFEAKETFRFVLVGNAGGLTLKLNDLLMPPLGHVRQVVKDKVIDRGTLQELQSELHNRT